MTTSQPRAYLLALSMRSQLLDRFKEVERELCNDGYQSILSGFVTIVADASISINMSIPNLNGLLRSGQWLNIYEAVHKETGKIGVALEKEVRRRIPGWYSQRKRIDNLLRFRRDTHYASMNLGGAGPQRYGACCVILNLHHWAPFYTCFGGDSIRACFDSDGNQVVVDEVILESFGVGSDAHRLAVLRHKNYLRDTKPGMDPNEIRNILEASDSLIEFHLHGPVTRGAIERVVMSRGARDHFWDLSKRSLSMPKPWPQEYDIVPFFLEMNRLLESYNIPFVVAEGR